MIGFIPFPRVLVLCEIQLASSRIWTRAAVSISYDDNHYTTGTSNFYDFRFKWTATAGIGKHPTKAWLSKLWISKMQSDTLEKRYAIKFCFKLEKMPQKRMECLGASCMNRASVCEWHNRFTESRESVRDDERCRRSKEVNTPELIGQTVRVTMLRF